MSTRYTNDHEWAKTDGDVITVGITDFAQGQLGEVVYVELPEVGTDINQGEEICVIESVKAAGDIKAPISGSIVEVNNTLDDQPELVNEDPAGEAWILKIKPTNTAELDSLMDDAAYQAYINDLA